MQEVIPTAARPPATLIARRATITSKASSTAVRTATTTAASTRIANASMQVSANPQKHFSFTKRVSGGSGVRLHLIDGTYELYRAHFAPRPGRQSPAGTNVKATVGIVESMLSLLNDAQEAVSHIAVAFDNPIRWFRNDLYPYYKSDAGVPPELHSQFDPAEDAMRAIGVTVWSMREYEADDALATGARKFRDQVEQVRIMTPDKDLGQCLLRRSRRASGSAAAEGHQRGGVSCRARIRSA